MNIINTVDITLLLLCAFYRGGGLIEISVVSGFRCGIKGILAILAFCAAYIGRLLAMFRGNLTVTYTRVKLPTTNLRCVKPQKNEDLIEIAF